MRLSNEYILTLRNLDGFGPASIKAIADYISQSSIVDMDLSVLLGHLREMLALKLLKGSAKTNFPDMESLRDANRKAVRIMKQSADLGIKMISVFECDYPANLKDTVDENGKQDVPIILFYKGDLSITRKPAVAIIGTREPTPEGIQAGEHIAAEYARSGFNIVSGLALGCDASGHRGALSVNGVTTAVLAHGLDSVYPEENSSLADSIVAKGGLLMSEYPIGVGVNRYNLVARDRLQAALADATIVVQTGLQGGAMHAVNATMAAKKPLYVVEYSRSIVSDKIEGNDYLRDNKGAIGLSSSMIKTEIQKLKQLVGSEGSLGQKGHVEKQTEPIQLDLFEQQ